MPVEGYITDLESKPSDPLDKTFVRFLYFDELDNSVEPSYEEQAVRGRSEEHLFWSHTGAEIYQFSIVLAASVNEKDNGTTKSIHDDWLFIKSFAYPDYGVNNKGPVLPPRKVSLRIGEFFRKTGAIMSPSAKLKKPFDAFGYPHMIDVSFRFRVISAIPRSLWEVRRGL